MWKWKVCCVVNRIVDDLLEEKLVVQEIVFGGGGDSEVGWDFIFGEVGAVCFKVVLWFVKCVIVEANRSVVFFGTIVSFKIHIFGKIGVIRVGKNGCWSKVFMFCVWSVLSDISVQLFVGVGRILCVLF